MAAPGDVMVLNGEPYLVVNDTDSAAAAAAAAAAASMMAASERNYCRTVCRFYTDVAVAGPVCVAGIIGSCLAFAALGLDAALSPTAAFLLRCLALSDGVLLVSCRDSVFLLPALLEFIGVDVDCRTARPSTTTSFVDNAIDVP